MAKTPINTSNKTKMKTNSRTITTTKSSLQKQQQRIAEQMQQTTWLKHSQTQYKLMQHNKLITNRHFTN